MLPCSGGDLSQLLEWILTLVTCDAAHIAVAIELPCGPVVDSLLDKDYFLFDRVANQYVTIPAAIGSTALNTLIARSGSPLNKVKNRIRPIPPPNMKVVAT